MRCSNANLYQNAYRASITDDLTSLYNRKHAFECIDHVCQHQKPSTLIVLDIDDFKLYNELYGAQESDNLIHRFAQVILQEISSKDIGSVLVRMNSDFKSGNGYR